MNNEQKGNNDTITKLFKLVIQKDLQSRYIKFAKDINDYLKKNYNQFFLCNILLQDKEDSRIIYSVELYNDIENKDDTYDYFPNILCKALYQKESKGFGKGFSRAYYKGFTNSKGWRTC